MIADPLVSEVFEAGRLLEERRSLREAGCASVAVLKGVDFAPANVGRKHPEDCGTCH